MIACRRWDPSHAEVYATNASAYIEQLLALQADVSSILEDLPAEQRILVTSHDSLGYLAAAYDFQVVATVIPGGSTTVEPSARDIAALTDLINEVGVPAIFGETVVNETVIQALADETGAALVTLYTDTLSSAGPANTYLDYLRYNMHSIVNALMGAD